MKPTQRRSNELAGIFHHRATAYGKFSQKQNTLNVSSHCKIIPHLKQNSSESFLESEYLLELRFLMVFILLHFDKMLTKYAFQNWITGTSCENWSWFYLCFCVWGPGQASSCYLSRFSFKL